MTTLRRTAILLVAALATIGLLASCSNDPAAEEPGASSTTTTTTAPSGPVPECDPRQSYAPLGSPDVDLLANDPKMQEIRARGRLIVGVASDVTLFGSLNPATGDLEGFDLDMGRQVAKAIFGNENAIQFVAMSFAERIPALQDGTVDLVADIMTMNCARWEVINFSTEYFTAGQQILVVKGGDVQSESDLAGKKACAADRSTSADRSTT